MWVGVTSREFHDFLRSLQNSLRSISSREYFEWEVLVLAHALCDASGNSSANQPYTLHSNLQNVQQSTYMVNHH